MSNLFDFLEDLEKVLLLIGRGNRYIVYIVSFLLNFRISNRSYLLTFSSFPFPSFPFPSPRTQSQNMKCGRLRQASALEGEEHRGPGQDVRAQIQQESGHPGWLPHVGVRVRAG